MPEPVTNSIWKLIILDKYVDFEKLYVTLDPDYSPQDEAKDIGDSFALLEKNSINWSRSGARTTRTRTEPEPNTRFGVRCGRRDEPEPHVRCRFRMRLNLNMGFEHRCTEVHLYYCT